MNIKRILSATLATVMAGTTLVSCSQPNLENLLPFNEESKVKEYSSAVEGAALTIYVDANAKDGGDGSEASPFKTIPEAQAKIRELKSGEGLPVGGITVLVKDGEYRITEGFVFTEEDSGTEECPITYVSESEFGAKITGALLLSASDFEPINEEEKSRIIDKSAVENIVKVDLKKYGLTSEDWGKYVSMGSHHTGAQYDDYDPDAKAEAEVFIGDRALVCARWPNTDWIIPREALDWGENLANGLANGKRNPEGPTFSLLAHEIERASQWSDLSDVWTFGYICATWAESRNKVEEFDFDAKTMHLKYSESYLTDSSRDVVKYYYFNLLDELDYDGEFYIDRENGILYVYKTADFYSERIKMSTMTDNLITLNNVSNITIKGFYISETRGNGISGSGNAITIDNCKILNIRGGGLSLNGNKINISNNELCNLGGYGISVSGGDSWNLIKSENVIYNNYIHDWARVETTYRSGLSVGGCGSLVSHNEIGNSPHQAISWGGPYHIFEYNEIYNVLTETADCGVFYAGRNYTSHGCVIRYNYIHDIGSKGVDNAFGIYFDDGMTGQTAYGNIIENISGRGFLIGGGRDNKVYNNIIISATNGPLCLDNRQRRGALDPTYWFQHHYILADQLRPYLENEIWMEAFPEYKDWVLYTKDYSGDLDDPMLTSNAANCVVKNNISYQLNSEPTGLKHWAHFDFDILIEEMNDISNNEIIFGFSDFPGMNNGDYTLREDAKAFELCPDFEPIPFNEIGRIK